jgi:rhodanese-related sulfurtransferase
MKRHLVTLLMLLATTGLASAAEEAKKDEFPYRARYPDAPVITTADLAKRYKDVTIIDVRSKYEYQTLHINGAVNVPLNQTFGDRIAAMRAKDDKPFVFYCNGKTCHKSYDAVLAAQKARVKGDLYAYDAGIFDWAKAEPEKTTLLGSTPIKPGELIEEAQFKARLLDPKAFDKKAENAVILDVRDMQQRDSALYPFRELRATLDEKGKIDAAIQKAITEKKPLLVYDQTGKQIQWFQYYLERKGLKDYYMMKGGSSAHFDAHYGKVTLGSGEKKEKETKKQ